MKVCPSCQNEYEDDVEACPDDGTELIPAPEQLEQNPELREVVHIAHDEATSVVDLEAIDAERQRRGIETAMPLVDDPDDDEEDDPDATGTINIDQLGKKKSWADATSEGDPPRGDTAIVPAPSPENFERTHVTRERKQPKIPKRADQKAKKKAGKRGLLIAGIVGGSLILAAGIVAAAFIVGAGSRAVLTVTSVPSGATVLLDAEEIGTAPLQRKVKRGSHVLELKLDGYLPFKEVIDVPEEGLPFMQPLDVDEDAPDKPDPPTAKADAGAGSAGADGAPVAATDDAGTKTTTDGGGPLSSPDSGVRAASADELIASFDALVDKGALDLAFEKLKEMVRVYPGDGRSNALFDKLADARLNAKRPTTTRTPKGPKKTNKQRAREAFAEGEMYYRERNYVEAKLRYKNATQLDPGFARAHRAIARIYQREDNVDRARYHLERFLGLGGPDPDYRVRRWLEQHPRQ